MFIGRSHIKNALKGETEKHISGDRPKHRVAATSVQLEVKTLYL
jgi:hypothetical protein